MYKMNFREILALITILAFSKNVCASNVFSKMKAGLDTIVITVQHKQADKKYEGLAYAKAIDKYEKLVARGFSPDSLRRNLAVSYYKINNTKRAEELFNELIIKNEANTLDIYYYAQSLKYNQKYDEADAWIEKYRELSTGDSRGTLQAKSASVVKKLMKAQKCKIEPVYFSSKYSEFGAVVLDSQVIFTSGRRDQSIIQYEYSWKGDPYLDIFSTPITKPMIYKDAELLTKGINSRFHDGPICYSADGQEVFVTRSNFRYGLPKYSKDKENHFLLYYAKRSGPGWGELQELSFNSTEYSCGHPSVSADNMVLYFSSDMPGGFGGSDIYYVHRVDSGWSGPVNMGSDINTEGNEMFPFVSTEGDIYFASNGRLGLGGFDIFMASKSKNGSYKVINMGSPLNSSSDDFSFYLLKNGKDGYFASNREGGKGDDDIYKFEFLDKPVLFLKLIGTTKDKKTDEVIPDAVIKIVDSDGNEVLKCKSDADGKFETEVSPDMYFNIKASKNKYEDTEQKFLADKQKADSDILYVDVLLNEIGEWGVFGFIYEKESQKGVDSVEIIITPKDGTGEIIKMTDVNGNFREMIQPETDYDILLKKRRFFTRRGEFTTKDMEPGWIDVKEFIEVEMEEIVVGKTIEIPNIYYDLAKWDIRPDAALELDKVVQFMLDNETITIELGSHTDSRGSNSSNQALSQKRAESAVNYIIKHGISSRRISAKGYGESKLKNRCADGVRCSEEEHQENRRTEIMIVNF